MSLFLCADQSAKARMTTMRSLNNKLHCAQCRRSCCVEWQTPCWDVLKWQPHWEDAVTLRLPSPAAARAKHSMASAIPCSSFVWQLQKLQRPRYKRSLPSSVAKAHCSHCTYGQPSFTTITFVFVLRQCLLSSLKFELFLLDLRHAALHCLRRDHPVPFLPKGHWALQVRRKGHRSTRQGQQELKSCTWPSVLSTGKL